jgi:hypothetical protein
MLFLQLVPGVTIVLERKNRPAVLQVAALADLLLIPKNFELISVGVVVTTAALIEILHFADDRAVAPKTGHAPMFPF